MYACESHARNHTVIIIAGDRDYCPAVERILNKKREWEIEMIAFRNSMSKRMKTLAAKNKNLEIIMLEDLIAEREMSCCFVKACLHPANQSEAGYKLPRSRPNAIILTFKDSPSEKSVEAVRRRNYTDYL